MATREELREALDDYVTQARKSERVLRSIRNWSCVIYVEATDLNTEGFTMVMRDTNTTIHDGTYEKPDLIVRGDSEDLANILSSGVTKIPRLTICRERSKCRDRRKILCAWMPCPCSSTLRSKNNTHKTNHLLQGQALQ